MEAGRAGQVEMLMVMAEQNSPSVVKRVGIFFFYFFLQL